MNKSELIGVLHENMEDLTKEQAKEIVELTLDSIKKAVAEGDALNIRSFGKIGLERVGGRFIRKENGQKVRVANKLQPTLTPSSEFMSLVDEKRED